jgi:hypothetical protein
MQTNNTETFGSVDAFAQGEEDNIVEDTSEIDEVDSGGVIGDSSNPFDVDSQEICQDRNVGTSIGDCARNFVLSDREEQLIELHDYKDTVVFLDLSSFS